MLKEHARAFGILSRLVDISCLVAAFFAAVYASSAENGLSIAAWLNPSSARGFAGWRANYLWVLAISVALWLLIAQYGQIYGSHRGERLSSTLRKQFQTVLVWVIATGFSVFSLKLLFVSRLFSIEFFALASALLIFRQIAVITTLHHVRRRGYNRKKTLIVGQKDRANGFAALLAAEHSTGYEIVEIVDFDGENSSEPADAQTKADLASADVDEVFISPSGFGEAAFELLALRLLKQGKRVHIVPGLLDIRLFRQRINDFAGLPVVSLGGVGLNGFQAFAKCALDLVGAIALLLLLSPLFALIALLIKLTSDGPVFFRQDRLGWGGKPFRLYKFRTMHSDAEQLLRSNPELYAKFVASDYKLPEEEDFRVTRWGRFLRKTSLDELPQLFNVLKGDMCLVGPRPIEPRHIEKYGDYAPVFLSVKPGLTGYWQINGRSTVPHPKRMVMELEYIRDQSINTDLNILLKTIPAVLKGKGAY
jgi:exopolysaccharide biosynthesis polyprenyl glycosylphosphotransferase